MALRKNMMGAAFAVAIVLGGCTPMSANREIGTREDRAVLVIENNNWADMTIYALRDGVRSRIGQVTALGRSKFVLPSAMTTGTAELRIMADPIGSSNRWVSQPVMVLPGQELRFRLENNVNLSSYTVFDQGRY
jgi:hypothetical protein